MVRRLSAAVTSLALVCACSGEGDAPVEGDASRDLAAEATPLAEDTSTRCQDGKDNDGDGYTDCADQDCVGFSFCRDLGPVDLFIPDASSDQPPPDAPAPDAPSPDAVAPDVAQPDAAHDLTFTPPDLVTPDAPVPDLPTPDAVVPDQSLGDTGIPCTSHHACPQQWFCYLGKCLRDPKMPVYHCGKPGSPPGHWCVDALGKKGVEAENPAYTCKDACDCGPAHCCKSGLCVKDTADPWKPGGAAIGSACTEGTDATYCCTAAECHAGRHAYGSNADRFFRCHNPATGSAQKHCGSRSCFGTACSCDPGEACVDTASQMPPGKTCLLLSGGTCVSGATAQMFYGYKASDLLPCCGKGCLAGSKCDAGWRRAGGRFAYERIIGTCGSCGNGKCEAGEYPATCPKDCTCGDGVCAPAEVSTCAADCSTCGNGKCDPWEHGSKVYKVYKNIPGQCLSDCGGCGDGWCGPTEGKNTCSADCANDCEDAAMYSEFYRVCGDGVCGDGSQRCWDPETCRTCPQDCGACRPMRTLQRKPKWLTDSTSAVWGSGAGDVFFVGNTGCISHFDGVKVTQMKSPINTRNNYVVMADIWGTSKSNIYAAGWSTKPYVAHLLQYDGVDWEKIAMPTGGPTTTKLRAVWGTSPTDVYAAGGSVVYRYDGAAWKAYKSPVSVLSGWGTSPTHSVVKGTTQAARFDGTKWTLLSAATTVPSQIWAASATNIFGIGTKTLLHSADGVSWTARGSVGVSLEDIWGVSSTEVYLAGSNWSSVAGYLSRYDGKKLHTVDPQIKGYKLHPGFNGVWASSSTDVYLVGRVSLAGGGGWVGAVLQYDGTSWRQLATGYRHQMTAVWGYGVSDFYAGSDGGRLVRHEAGQSTEMDLRPHGCVQIYNLWGASGTDVFVACGGVFRAQGSSVTKISAAPMRSVWGSSATSVVGVGKGGAAGRFDGVKWIPQASGTTLDLHGVHGSSSTNIYAVGGMRDGYSGVVLRHDGKGWSVAQTYTGRSIHAVWVGGPKQVYAVGVQRVSGKRRDAFFSFDGTTWTTSSLGTATVLESVWGRPGEVYAVGYGSTIEISAAVFRHAGAGWKRVHMDFRIPDGTEYSCPYMYGVGGTQAGHIFLAGSGESIFNICPGKSCP